MSHKKFLKQTVQEALKGINNREGGPFGAVIVRDGRVIGKGHNTVLMSHDPTAHAEVNAIRKASANLENHHLTNSIIYSNFEPCPMCLSAIYWADIRIIYYSAGREIAEKIGFMDNKLYREIAHNNDKREIKSFKIKLPEMDFLLEDWESMEGKILY